MQQSEQRSTKRSANPRRGYASSGPIRARILVVYNTKLKGVYGSAMGAYGSFREATGRQKYNASPAIAGLAFFLFVNFRIYFMSKSSKIFKYVGKRLLQGVPIIIAIVVINFFLLNLAEGDAVDVLAGELDQQPPSIWTIAQKIWTRSAFTGSIDGVFKNVVTLDLGYFSA